MVYAPMQNATRFVAKPAARAALSGPFCLALLLAGLLLGCRDEPRHVVLILLDAARADRFSCYGYTRSTTPNMDALAAGGAIFLNHFSQATTTADALPGLFYSRYFSRPLLPLSASVPLSNPDDLFRTDDSESISLPQLLSSAGFRTAIVSAHPWIKPGTRLTRDVDELHDLSTVATYPEKYGYPPAPQVVDRAIAWIEENQEQDFFLYVHLMDTHFPHFMESDARAFLRETGYSDADLDRFEIEGWDHSFPLGAERRDHLDALYDGSLRYADREVGRLLERLSELGIGERTLVVITSDHGELLLESPQRMGHGGPWYDLLGRVPFIVSLPGRLAPRRTGMLTEHVDVLPTVAGLLGVSVPQGRVPDGLDLTRVLEGELSPKPYAFGPWSVRSARYKAFFDESVARSLEEDGRELPSEVENGHLYDLANDPLERRNLWGSRPRVRARLLAAYLDAMRRPYHRHLASVSREQPRSAFAISANHFELDGPSEQGWKLNQGWNRFLLRAEPSAPPLEVRLRLPNGRYRVAASVRGEGRVTLAGDVVVLASASDEIELVPLGTVEVTDETFRAKVAPEARSGFAIRYFGFRPWADDAGDPADVDPGLTERLRVLGYVE
jgi:arylsulfatase A-like enzyme